MTTEQLNAKGRFVLDDWKNILSIQYSNSQSRTDVMIAGRVHDSRFHIPDISTPPATTQPAPVMDKYNGLRLALKAYNTSHHRNAAAKRIAPHTDRLNTNHRSRVTLKGRLGIDQVRWNRIKCRLRVKRVSVLWLAILYKVFTAIADIGLCNDVWSKLFSIRQVIQHVKVGKDVIHTDLREIFACLFVLQQLEVFVAVD